MREHIELVYILQNRVELGMVYISNRLFSEPVSFTIGAPSYHLDFFDSRKFEFWYFTLESILNWWI